MSTLDVACGRCDKRFRVRAEFAGKNTRCPGCSAPIAIGGPTPAAPRRREEPAELPRPRPRPRDDDDDRPRTPAGDWGPVDTALGREQTAVVFVLVTILASYFVYCLGAAAGGPGPGAEGIVIALMLLLLVGPSLAAGVFGMTARVSALRAPPASLSRPTAVASLLCGIAGLVSLVMLGFTLLSSIESQQHHSELPAVVSIGGLVLSTLAALVTFAGFVAQVGMARRSAEVSRAVGRMAVAVCVCLLGLIGIGILYTLAAELTEPSGGYMRGYPYGYRDDGPFYAVVTGILMPLAFGVILVLHHRLLAAARRSVRGEAADGYHG
jgi:hypothetical protein